MINQVKRSAILVSTTLLILQLVFPITSVIAQSEMEDSTVGSQIETISPHTADLPEKIEEDTELSTANYFEETDEIHEEKEIFDVEEDLTLDQDTKINESDEDLVFGKEEQNIEAYNLGPNLLLNPTFSYNRVTNGGTITNWQMSRSTTPVNVITRNITMDSTYNLNGNTWISTTGSMFSLRSDSLAAGRLTIANQSNTGTVILSQTISTIPGRTYQMSSQFATTDTSNDGPVTFTMLAYNGNNVVSGTGQLSRFAFNMTDNVYSTRNMQFTATGNQTTIVFHVAGGSRRKGWIRLPQVAVVNRNLTLQASPVEGGNPSANTTSVTPGTSTTITANPNNGYRFVRWESVSGDGVITDPNSESTTFTMGNSDATVRAIYEQLPRTLTLEASPPEGGSPTSGVNSLTQGQTTTLSANTNSGYQFGHWEIVSGAGAQIEDLTEPETAFTMGNEDTVVRAIYEANQSGEVHVHHVDLDGHELVDSEVLEGTLGTDYETFPQEIEHYQLVDDPDNANGVFTEDLIVVTYVYKATNVLPVDPLDPETEVDPENKPELPDNQGLLSLDFASQFQFGTQAISAKEKTYYAQPQRLLNEDGTVNEDEERPNYIQISDRRNENERNGWQLAVTQAEQFSSETGKLLNQASLQLMNQELVSAQNGEAPSLMMGNPLTLIPGNKRTLLRAEGTEGQGTWIYRFGDADSAGESVALNIPQGAAPDAETYTTRLLWELSIVPGNNID